MGCSPLRLRESPCSKPFRADSYPTSTSWVPFCPSGCRRRSTLTGSRQTPKATTVASTPPTSVTTRTTSSSGTPRSPCVLRHEQARSWRSTSPPSEWTSRRSDRSTRSCSTGSSGSPKRWYSSNSVAAYWRSRSSSRPSTSPPSGCVAGAGSPSGLPTGSPSGSSPAITRRQVRSPSEESSTSLTSSLTRSERSRRSRDFRLSTCRSSASCATRRASTSSESSTLPRSGSAVVASTVGRTRTTRCRTFSSSLPRRRRTA